MCVCVCHSLYLPLYLYISKPEQLTCNEHVVDNKEAATC